MPCARVFVLIILPCKFCSLAAFDIGLIILAPFTHVRSVYRMQRSRTDSALRSSYNARATIRLQPYRARRAITGSSDMRWEESDYNHRYAMIYKRERVWERASSSRGFNATVWVWWTWCFDHSYSPSAVHIIMLICIGISLGRSNWLRLGGIRGFVSVEYMFLFFCIT